MFINTACSDYVYRIFENLSILNFQLKRKSLHNFIYYRVQFDITLKVTDEEHPDLMNDLESADHFEEIEVDSPPEIPDATFDVHEEIVETPGAPEQKS